MIGGEVTLSKAWETAASWHAAWSKKNRRIKMRIL
jgi:hypothetical protein